MNDKKIESIQYLLQKLKVCFRKLRYNIRCLGHGDAFLENVLKHQTSGKLFFIDPRTQWESKITTDGYMDPLYDYATCLHSHCIVSIFEHANAAECLLDDSGIYLKSSINMESEKSFIDYQIDCFLSNKIPQEWKVKNIHASIYILIANALWGWVKYPKTLKTQNHLVHVYASVCFFLHHALECINTRST